jgi:hypothetical protein
LKDKIKESEKSSKNKNIRDLYRSINEFNQGLQPGTNLAEGGNSDLLADFHSILSRWENFFFFPIGFYSPYRTLAFLNGLLDPQTFGRTPWLGDQSNMPRAGFETAI